MYIYSVTIQIQKEAEQDWLDFMQQKHIADVLSSGYLKSCSMRKSLEDAKDGYSTYSMEYTAASKEDLENYRQKAAPALQKDVTDRFEGRFTANRVVYTLLFQK